MEQPARMQRAGALDIRPELAFVALALAFGSLLAVATPPHDAPDEPRHLQRVWLLSEGRLSVPGAVRGSGGAIPESLLALHPPYTRGTIGCRHSMDEWRASASVPLAPEHRTDEIRTPILYGPIGYLPAAIATVPARALGASAGGLFYLARFSNLIAWTAVCALAILLIPAGRWALVTAALLPMSLFEASTVSADAMTNALALLLLALTVRLAALGAGGATPRALAATVAVVALLGLGKPGYTLLALLVLAIPADRFAGALQRRLFVLASIGVGLVVPAAWWLGIQAVGPFPYPKADPGAQIEGIVAAPWSLLSVVALSLGERAAEFARGTIGILGRLDVVLPSWTYAGYIALLAGVAAVDDSEAAPIAPRTRAVLGVLAVGGIATITALLYVSASQPGAARVVGIQGRYFLPFVPVALIAFPVFPVAWLPARPIGWIVAIACSLGLVATLHSLLLRYYAV